MSEAELDQIVIDGQVRRFGSLRKPDNFVSAFPTFESVHPVYDDSDIRKLITEPNRRTARAVFDVKWVVDQHEFGSCNGWALANVLARARWLRGLQDGKKFSGANAYSRMNGNRDNGSALEDGLKVIQQYGCAPFELVPYNCIYASQQPKNADVEAAKYKGLSAFAVGTKQGLRTALAAGFPCVVAVHVGNRFSTLRNGISGVDNGIGNHAVCVDDLVLRNGTECFDMANSWSERFGTEGRSYLVWDHFAQTFDNHVFYACASTEESGE